MSSEPPIEKPRSLAAAWVVLLLLLWILGILKWRSESNQSACFLNTRNAQQAMRSFQGINGMFEGEPLDKSKLIGPGNFIDSEYHCPGSGTYTWSPMVLPMGDLYLRCSHPDHQIDPAITKDW